MAMAIGCFMAGCLFGATAIIVVACCAVADDEPILDQDGKVHWGRKSSRAEPLTKKEWRVGLNQDMKDRGNHL